MTRRGGITQPKRSLLLQCLPPRLRGFLWSRNMEHCLHCELPKLLQDRIAELERELADAQDYAAELEAKVAELEAKE
jgi:hypothetical protein